MMLSSRGADDVGHRDSGEGPFHGPRNGDVFQSTCKVTFSSFSMDSCVCVCVTRWHAREIGSRPLNSGSVFPFLFLFLFLSPSFGIWVGMPCFPQQQQAHLFKFFSNEGPLLLPFLDTTLRCKGTFERVRVFIVDADLDASEAALCKQPASLPACLPAG